MRRTDCDHSADIQRRAGEWGVVWTGFAYGIADDQPAHAMRQNIDRDRLLGKIVIDIPGNHTGKMENMIVEVGIRARQLMTAWGVISGSISTSNPFIIGQIVGNLADISVPSVLREECRRCGRL